MREFDRLKEKALCVLKIQAETASCTTFMTSQPLDQLHVVVRSKRSSEFPLRVPGPERATSSGIQPPPDGDRLCSLKSLRNNCRELVQKKGCVPRILRGPAGASGHRSLGNPGFPAPRQATGPSAEPTACSNDHRLAEILITNNSAISYDAHVR